MLCSDIQLRVKNSTYTILDSPFHRSPHTNQQVNSVLLPKHSPHHPNCVGRVVSIPYPAISDTHLHERTLKLVGGLSSVKKTENLIDTLS